jgi:transcription termination/antitermination protein NusA
MSAFGGKADIANKFVRLSVIATARIRLMKWILDRIRHVIGIRSQEPASGHDPITPADPHETDEVESSRRVEVNFDAKRKELGVDDSLKDVPGVTTPMLVAFGEHGIKSIEDLADCATDDLDGWSESKDGKTIRHAGILDRFEVSREDCETLIINARIKAGWIK